MSMWIGCFALLFCYCFWIQSLLSPVLCIVIAHKVLSWDLGLSVLDAPLLCKSTCEEDAVKGNRVEVRRNSSLDFYYNLVWKPWLSQLTQPWKGPMCFSSSVAGGEPPTPKISQRALLGRAPLGFPCCLLLWYSLGHRLLALGAAWGFWGELGFVSSHPPAWAAGVGLHPALQMEHCMGSAGPYCKWCRVGLAQLPLSPCSFLSGCS